MCIRDSSERSDRFKINRRSSLTRLKSAVLRVKGGEMTTNKVAGGRTSPPPPFSSPIKGDDITVKEVLSTENRRDRYHARNLPGRRKSSISLVDKVSNLVQNTRAKEKYLFGQGDSRPSPFTF